jgi:hypothetical protein
MWNFFRTRSWQAHRRFSRLILVVLVAAPAPIKAETVHPDIKVALQPELTAIAVIDNLRFTPNADSVERSLRSSLKVEAPGADPYKRGYSTDARVRHYRFYRLRPAGKVQRIYRGNIASAVVEGVYNGPGSIPGAEAVYNDGKAKNGRLKS